MGNDCDKHGREMRTAFWWETQKERDKLEDSGVDGWILLKQMLKGQDKTVWAEFFYLV